MATILNPSGAPYMYDYQNVSTTLISPSTIHVHSSAVAMMFKRYLLEKAKSVYKWTMPEEWAENYALACLYEVGFFVVLNTSRFGIIPQGGTLGGYTVQYQPRHAVICNPLFDKSYELVLDRDCGFIYLCDDYRGIYDLVDYYGDMMALACEAAGMNITNSKLAYVLIAKNKQFAESMKKAFDDVQSGNPATVIDSALLDKDGNLNVQFFNNNLGQNFIAPELFTVIKQLESQFDTAVGIPNMSIYKKERTNTDEVNSNNTDVFVRADKRLQRMKKQCEKACKLFGKPETWLGVEWRVNPMETVSNDNGIQSTQNPSTGTGKGGSAK